MDILIEGLDAWFQDQPLDPTPFHPRYAKLIYQQNRLGWQQVFSGRLSNEWARLQDDHLYAHNQLGKTRSGRLWTTMIIQTIWQEWHKLWLHRNETIHGHDMTTRTAARKRFVEAKLRALYAKREAMRARDRNIFFDTVEEHLTRPLIAQENWILTYGPLVRHSVKEA